MLTANNGGQQKQEVMLIKMSLSIFKCVHALSVKGMIITTCQT